jgi:hypothetical protein
MIQKRTTLLVVIGTSWQNERAYRALALTGGSRHGWMKMVYRMTGGKRGSINSIKDIILFP